jgi:SecD/SecF fusion protein
VWIRFGGIRYGIGAILSLMHDAVVAVAATVLSGVLYNYVFHKHTFLLITDFKINLTMIAAYLTVIGYSVNDTIVIFDRVRELRGKANRPLTAQLVNDAINQCFGRTIWTTFTVFIVVLIMYVWGGEAIRGFSFAMLCGVVTGAYSTLAIASPMLLATASAADKAPTSKPNLERRSNPFLAKPSSK